MPSASRICASTKCPLRHLAMTGIVTAAMIDLISSGSDIRAAPPSLRMSAGTRSSAITAHAPASWAILACSAVTTSMITPPFSIWARPALTLKEPFTDPLPLREPLRSATSEILRGRSRIAALSWGPGRWGVLLIAVAVLQIGAASPSPDLRQYLATEPGADWLEAPAGPDVIDGPFNAHEWGVYVEDSPTERALNK